MSNPSSWVQVPRPARIGLSVAATILFALIVVSCGLHIFDPVRFPAPEALGVEGLLAVSLVAIIVTHFPWQSLKVGNLEMQRLAQDMTEDFGATVQTLMEEEFNDTTFSLVAEESNAFGPIRRESHPDDMEAIAHPAETVSPPVKSGLAGTSRAIPALLDFLNQDGGPGLTIEDIVAQAKADPSDDGLRGQSPAAIRAALSVLALQKRVAVRVEHDGTLKYYSR